MSLCKKRVSAKLLIAVMLIVFLNLSLIAGCSNNQSSSSSNNQSSSGDSPANSETVLILGTSSVGSAFYAVAVGIADIITRHAGIKVTVEAVGGSDANMRALKDKKVDLAIVNSGSAVNAFHGTEQFKKDGKIPVSLLAQGQLSMRPIVARADAGIQTPADLKGKRFISRRKAMAEVEQVGRAVCKAYGVAWDDVKVIETAEVNEAIDALKMGSADAAIIPSGVPNATLTDLSQSTDTVFLSLTDDKLRTVLDELGSAFRKGIIPAGTYKGQNKDIIAPAMSTLLVARPDLPQDMAYKVVKALMDNPAELKAVHSAGKDWNVQNTLESPPIPFSSGAVRYFKDAGVWKEGLDKQK